MELDIVEYWILEQIPCGGSLDSRQRSQDLGKIINLALHLYHMAISHSQALPLAQWTWSLYTQPPSTDFRCVLRHLPPTCLFAKVALRSFLKKRQGPTWPLQPSHRRPSLTSEPFSSRLARKTWGFRSQALQQSQVASRAQNTEECILQNIEISNNGGGNL